MYMIPRSKRHQISLCTYKAINYLYIMLVLKVFYFDFVVYNFLCAWACSRIF